MKKSKSPAVDPSTSIQKTRSSQCEISSGLGKSEKKEMRDSVEKTWKELLIYEAEQNRVQSKLLKTSKISQKYQTAKNISKLPQTEPSVHSTSSNQSLLLHIHFNRATSTTATTTRTAGTVLYDTTRLIRSREASGKA